MAKTKISEYSSTANSNTDIASINIDEGCAPSGINNAIRALMAQIHDLYAGTSGDTWPVTAGGTGSGTASGARTNLGLAIGTDVQAYNAALAAIAANNGTNMMKNRIINGAMMIDQRNAGASVSTTATTAYTVDRFAYFATQASKFTVQQNAGSVTPPLGFVNYLGVTSSSAYSVISSDNFGLKQVVEGNNIADFNWGTANAQPVTLSFWVRSSITGTFGGSLLSIAANRSYPFTYTISASNTWQQITVSVPAITSGSWNTNNNEGVQVVFGLGVGSTLSGTAGSWATGIYTSATGATSVVGTSGATFYITGVQLEKGSTATSFDYRPYGTELALCQRYYEKSYDIGTTPGSSTVSGAMTFIAPIASSNHRVCIPFAVRKRATPSTQYWDMPGTASRQTSYTFASGAQTDGVNGVSSIQAYESNLWLNFVTGATPVSIQMHWAVSAEL